MNVDRQTYRQTDIQADKLADYRKIHNKISTGLEHFRVRTVIEKNVNRVQMLDKYSNK